MKELKHFLKQKPSKDTHSNNMAKFFHGTHKPAAVMIEREGLKPVKQLPQEFQEQSKMSHLTNPDKVYLYKDKADAKTWSEVASRFTGFPPAIIQVDVPKKTVTPDLNAPFGRAYTYPGMIPKNKVKLLKDDSSKDMVIRFGRKPRDYDKDEWNKYQETMNKLTHKTTPFDETTKMNTILHEDKEIKKLERVNPFWRRPDMAREGQPTWHQKYNTEAITALKEQGYNEEEAISYLAKKNLLREDAADIILRQPGFQSILDKTKTPKEIIDPRDEKRLGDALDKHNEANQIIKLKRITNIKSDDDSHNKRFEGRVKPRYPKREGFRITWKDTEEVLRKHKEVDGPEYDVTNPSNQIGSRLPNATEFIKNKDYMLEGGFEPPLINKKGNISDGRHRLLALKNLGYTTIPIEEYEEINRDKTSNDDKIWSVRPFNERYEKKIHPSDLDRPLIKRDEKGNLVPSEYKRMQGRDTGWFGTGIYGFDTKEKAEEGAKRRLGYVREFDIPKPFKPKGRFSSGELHKGSKLLYKGEYKEAQQTLRNAGLKTTQKELKESRQIADEIGEQPINALLRRKGFSGVIPHSDFQTFEYGSVLHVADPDEIPIDNGFLSSEELERKKEWTKEKHRSSKTIKEQEQEQEFRDVYKDPRSYTQYKLFNDTYRRHIKGTGKYDDDTGELIGAEFEEVPMDLGEHDTELKNKVFALRNLDNLPIPKKDEESQDKKWKYDYTMGWEQPAIRTKIKLVNPNDLQFTESEEGKNKMTIKRIKESGDILEPVEAWNKYTPEQKLQIKNGHHRTIAARERGDKLIPVLIYDKQNDREYYRRKHKLPPYNEEEKDGDK